MQDTDSFFTIVGQGHLMGMRPFRVGRIVRLAWEGGRLTAKMPFLGTVGYGATTPETVCDGTLSATALPVTAGEAHYATVAFVTPISAIVRLLPPAEESTLNRLWHQTEALFAPSGTI